MLHSTSSLAFRPRSLNQPEKVERTRWGSWQLDPRAQTLDFEPEDRRAGRDHALREEYNDHTRRALLEGLYGLSDCCITHLKEESFGDGEGRPYSELQLMKDFAEEGLRSGDFSQAFCHIKDCHFRVIPLPPEVE